MRKFFTTLVVLLSICALNTSAQTHYDGMGDLYAYQTRENASITFKNRSSYTMTVKIMKSYGGLYETVVLGPNSNRKVYFSSTSTYKMKIKATKNGSVSYHDGGSFSVTCDDYEWTEGEISFSLSSYGNGLGPSISTKEFESNY